ncbi:alanine racemase [Microbacterium sp. OR16]|uniref:alanine racemase n=1 Tax=Microbacterium sp. OR16 TaxID=3095345 RepID=UPI0039B5A8BD
MTVSSALPRVLLSRGALDRAARALVAPGARVDLRHDGFGHGAADVLAVLAEAGVTDVIVDPADVAAASAHADLNVQTDGEADVDPAALFGIPDASVQAPREPVMSLQGRVLSTKSLRAGEAVSYGYTHRAADDTRVALVTGGYAQGIPRILGNRVRVGIGDRMLPIVGRIAMDVCVVDLEGGEVDDGAPVVYFGGRGGARDGLAGWSTVSGLTPLEMAVVIGLHGQKEWTA